MKKKKTNKNRVNNFCDKNRLLLIAERETPLRDENVGGSSGASPKPKSLRRRHEIAATNVIPSDSFATLQTFFQLYARIR